MFETQYSKVIAMIKNIDPIAYGKTRNYIDGKVTYLSPYISRGVISTQQVLKHIASKGYKLYQIESFVKELAWRDYFQRVWQEKNIDAEIKNEQLPVLNYQLPTAITQANTGIEGIDNSIDTLYTTGYMHNHARMYVAGIVCNIALSHWKLPAHWMYYHLLDGDWASNACSWQWVAGANSSKKYIADEENVNKYTRTNSKNTFLKNIYDTFGNYDVPSILKDTEDVSFTTSLPTNPSISINQSIPTCIYNYYNLDPAWKKDINANRVFLLEPSVFERYPIGNNALNFALKLSDEIENMQLFVGEFNDLKKLTGTSTIFYKEHPLNKYSGTEDSRSWMVKEVQGYYPSFFAYWKKIEPYIKKNYF